MHLSQLYACSSFQIVFDNFFCLKFKNVKIVDVASAVGGTRGECFGGNLSGAGIKNLIYVCGWEGREINISHKLQILINKTKIKQVLKIKSGLIIKAPFQF